MQDKIKVLVAVGYYLPGYKAGGPLKTIVNMVEQLSDEFEFWIVTRDRDLGDEVPYENVKLNQWVAYSKAKVFYASPKNLNIFYFARLINQTPCDVLYLNSFFDTNFTIKLLLARKFGLYKMRLPVVIAPRGEFSSGALQIKMLKKQIFIKVAGWFDLYKGVVWQASSEFEKKDVECNFDTGSQQVLIAKNLPEKKSFIYNKDRNVEKNIILQVVFLSRILPMKNLDYALRVLQKVSIPIKFDIYGPIEDLSYWEECKKIIKNMPINIEINHFGSLHPKEVSKIFLNYDLFFFPTRGENYGHVIAESLSVGTPVLLSDQTPWKNLKKDKLGLDLPLADESDFVQAIHSYYITITQQNNIREIIQKNALKRIFNPIDIEANKNLFLFAIKE